jgi:hypothetical protein
LAMRQEVEKACDDLRRGSRKIRSDHDAGPKLRTWKCFVAGLAVALAVFGVGIWVGARLR